MKKRGRVLREPCTGSGLLIVEGQQHWFRPEEVRKAEARLRAGMPVVVTFDRYDHIVEITAVSETQFAEKQGAQSVKTGKAAAMQLLRNIAKMWRR